MRDNLILSSGLTHVLPLLTFLDFALPDLDLDLMCFFSFLLFSVTICISSFSFFSLSCSLYLSYFFKFTTLPFSLNSPAVTSFTTSSLTDQWAQQRCNENTNRIFRAYGHPRAMKIRIFCPRQSCPLLPKFGRPPKFGVLQKIAQNFRKSP